MRILYENRQGLCGRQAPVNDAPLAQPIEMQILLNKNFKIKAHALTYIFIHVDADVKT